MKKLLVLGSLISLLSSGLIFGQNNVGEDLKDAANSTGKAATGATKATGGAVKGAANSVSDFVTGKVNINKATKAQLEKVKGIGDKAKDIIAYRTAHKSFSSLDELAKVPGFSADLVASLKDKLSIN